ncbi:MAG: hypothetical protein AAGK00_18415 [Pseudomonadota bacterium]
MSRRQRRARPGRTASLSVLQHLMEPEMLLQRTISQLDIGPLPPARAEEMGQLGYLQWLGALKGRSSYIQEAMRAHEQAAPFRQRSPAIAVFCDLLVASTRTPMEPLPLAMPDRRRRGGALARRRTV